MVYDIQMKKIFAQDLINGKMEILNANEVKIYKPTTVVNYLSNLLREHLGWISADLRENAIRLKKMTLPQRRRLKRAIRKADEHKNFESNGNESVDSGDSHSVQFEDMSDGSAQTESRLNDDESQ